MAQAQTPYSPPLARVSDPAETDVPKPAAIRHAASCLWISAALAVLFAGLAIGGVSSAEVGVAPLIFIGAFTVGGLALVAWQLNAGRGWVRWLSLVVFGLGSGIIALGIIIAPQTYLALPLLDKISAVVQFGLQTAALILMFTPAAGHWLASRKGK